MTLKLIASGDSTDGVPPKENLHRERLNQGDALDLETSTGMEQTPDASDLAAQIEVAERVMREDRDVLQKLAE